MLKKSISLAAITFTAIGLSACDVDKTKEGNVTVPKYELEQKQAGNVTAPEYNVKTPGVNVTQEEKTVDVPKVETEEKKIDVPNVNVTPAREK